MNRWLCVSMLLWSGVFSFQIAASEQADALIRQLMAHRLHPAEESHEKLTFSLNNLEDDSGNYLIRFFPLLQNHTEISAFDNQPVVTLSLREKKRNKGEITFQQHIGVDESFDTDGQLTRNMDEYFHPVSVFDDKMTVLKQKFVGPLSPSAFLYYCFEVLDTVEINNQSLVNLSFTPTHHPENSFSGKIQIALEDSCYSLRKIQMNASHSISVNYLKRLQIEQSFTTLPDGSQQLEHEEIYAVFRAAKMSVQAHWVCRSDSPISLSEQENFLPILMILLRDYPTYNLIIKPLEMLILGYIPVGSPQNYFNIGPIASTVAYNPIEGFRLRLGGITTEQLHPKWFFGGYMAYGFKDKRMKYQARIIHKKPNLSFTHTYDLSVPGNYTNDNVFYSLQPGIAEMKMQYVRTSELAYEKEWKNDFSLQTWLRYADYEAAGELQYSDFQTATIGLQVSYKPITLSHQTGLKAIFGSDYTYNYSQLNIKKQFDLENFGRLETFVKAGKMWDKAPFPLLAFPSTNQSLFLDSQSFMLMRSMEFVSDEFVSLFTTYHLNGLIFRQIPLLNRWKWREVVSASMMYGRLSDKNNPDLSSGLFAFPSDIHPFASNPYAEMSVGIENIFRFLRVDFFRRLTYLDEPDIRKWGFRLGFRLIF